MAKENRKKTGKKINTHIRGGGEIIAQEIGKTLEENYMPYAMSVIISRAIPEIDGFKPSHRKILYMMYKMGLLQGARTKSANVVGQTMKLNPHGDMAIYETLVRLSRGHEALIHPYIDSKGNFGKHYSRDMAFAASRYTEVKLSPICQELFRDIDKETVSYIQNYDNTMKEPTLLPTTYPSILVNANMGIAVGMASSICSFNLVEVCEATIGLIRNKEYAIEDSIKGPDFSGGGFLLYQEEVLKGIYETGRGTVKIRGRYQVDTEANCIDIYQIPPNTTIEAIVDKIVDLVKLGKIKEISDIRDETDLKGLKITLDLKRGVDAEYLMRKLYKLTPLEDTFSCNFNLLVQGKPRVLGVRQILLAWIDFRKDCVYKRVSFDLEKRKKRSHLLKGLESILMDLDKAIEIVRNTEEEEEVVPNLMIGFGIDEIQGEYVAEIKLRNLNRRHILNRIGEIGELEAEIVEMEETLGKEEKIGAIVIKELKEVSKLYGKERSTLIIDVQEEDISFQEEVKSYPVTLFFTKEGYFKKITPQSLRMSGEQKLKETDEIKQIMESDNREELLFFTDKCQAYKGRVSDFSDGKSSLLGDFIPSKLGLEPGENTIGMVCAKEYKGHLIFFYENGRIGKVPLSSYETKTNRKKLVNALNGKSKVVEIFHILEEQDFVIETEKGRVLLLFSELVPEKATKSTQGIIGITLKEGDKVKRVFKEIEELGEGKHRYRAKKLPSTGILKRKNQLGFEEIL